MEIQMQAMRVDYTEVPSGATDDEENFPSSFRKQESRAKHIFPWLRSYMFRRQLSFAGVASIFIIAGVLVSLVEMKRNDHELDFGEFHHIIFSEKQKRTKLIWIYYLWRLYWP
mmetsp:Transcript_24122/g.52056  ORF Transcript_24122/g.52056 Transcript_24122/m.52056 type:complete len:113 (+) Transcript_24122:128-466(+)